MPHALQRRWELDALRGLMLVLMTLTHMPTMYSLPTGQPLGFVSAAEGFVFLSAFMAGRVYGNRARRDGVVVMQSAFHQRAFKLYLCQLGLLLLAFTVIAWLGVHNRQGGVTGLLEFFFIDPQAAVLGAALLLHNPPLLDILPLYIALMLVSPWLLRHALRHGWAGVLSISALLWVAEQWGLGLALHELVGLPIPYKDMGAFHWFAWQALWVTGLWLGARQQPLPRIPFWCVVPAAMYAAGMLLWRHMVGQDPMPGVPAVGLLLDKWSLGPLRVLNFASVFVLLVTFGPWLKQVLPRPLPLELLGRNSLSVFCAHIVIALFTLAFFGSPEVVRPWSTDVALLASAFAGLFAVAMAVETRERLGGRAALVWQSGPQVR
ncbi:OpgC domain-containing protein [Hydrogenophaga sp.]|uniref:OpgC domain-containing protein n=1 Tax=Hydrogenophaga sp. TaxID=1904254 RepID=UPI00272F29C2|nr:OpgC domain-containing protein [Hydrogenophaga sp.]MDP2016277.1 OpgC domain-containing protein [Hydrogenophaga sp.]MDP3165041.1 OpgC domain-containing protein [Hydrogenophaga sp.]